MIDSRPEPKTFGVLGEPWQWDTFRAIAPALESVTGHSEFKYEGPRSFWFTRGRGHDKTSSIARLLNWVLKYSRKYLSIALAAGDSDQAALIVEAMQAEGKLNPWLSKGIEYGRTKVKGPCGVVKILTADAGSNFGLNNDLVVADELTHWAKPDLWGVLWSGREKRPGSVFIVITNAGVIGSWQHTVWRQAKDDPTWSVIDTPPGVHLASWMDEAAVMRMRKMLPRGLARRVIDNIWIDPAEEADYISREEVRACELLGRDLGLRRMTRGLPGIRYVVGIDYGPKRDRTALCVVHWDKDRDILIVDKMDVWQGAEGSTVPIKEVENWIREANKEFTFPDLVIDPYQMEGTIQHFELSNIVDRFEARAGKRTFEMAEHLRSLIASRKIAWYPGCGDLRTSGAVDTLEDEIAGLVLKVTPYGYRFDHTVKFHDDRAVALGMAALYAARMDKSAPGVRPSGIEKVKAVDYNSTNTWRRVAAAREVGPARRGIFGIS